MKFYLLLIIAASFIIYSCKKKEALTISEAPSIELLSVNQSQVTEFVDSLVFTISYRDGDGNLGTESPDSTVIELRDNRDSENLIFGYHLSPRSPNGSSLIVQGQLQIVLKNIIILNSANNSETTSFSIRIKDRAQNWSNMVESGEISINR
jgi:hypothetical protein